MDSFCLCLNSIRNIDIFHVAWSTLEDVSVNTLQSWSYVISGMCPALRTFRQQVTDECRKQGYLCTVSGRRRLFPSISTSDPVIRAQTERQAINFVIQGKLILYLIQHLQKEFNFCVDPVFGWYKFVEVGCIPSVMLRIHFHCRMVCYVLQPL